MTIGYHVVFGTYGFWLPNDPRGSWSDFVGSWDLYKYGPATKTDDTRSVAHRSHDRKVRLAAKNAINYLPVHFTDDQTASVATGFAKYVAASKLVVWACAIMPDHVHLVVAFHELKLESLIIQLKGQATRALLGAGIHPFGHIDKPTPKCFARGEWKVYLYPEDIPRAVAYVESNPVKEGKPQQHWPFVVPYQN